MKKRSIYFISLFTIAALTACNENFEDWAAPQSNEPEEAKNLLFEVANTSATFNLATISADSIELAKQTKLTADAETTVSYEVQFDKETDFAAKLHSPANLVNGGLRVAKADLQQIVETLYGKRPEERQLLLRVKAYVATPEGQTSQVQSNNLTVTVTPKAPLIESAYYLIGNMNGWADTDASKLIKLVHSGRDVYDDPIFTALLKVPAACFWKVIPQSRVNALNAGTSSNVWGEGVLGSATNGDTSETGKLITADPQAMQIEAAGWVRITLNMMEYTYQVEALGEVSPYLWVPGNHQGWAPDKAPKLYSANMDMVYTGHLYLNGGFKLTGQPAWPSGGVGVDYGFSNFNTLTANITDDGGNFAVTEGFYFLKSSMGTKAIEAVKTQWGIIGAAVGGWDAANDVVMTYDKATNCWSVTADLSVGEFKFRANKAWDINMGGTADKLTFNNGTNLQIATAGNYTVKLYLTNDESSYCTLKKN